MADNERDFTRVMFSTRAEVDVNGQTIHGEINDISMNGIHLMSDCGAAVGDGCDVRIYLGEQNPLVIHALGQVARRDDGGFAVNFTGLYCDSYDHLKKIVLLNASNREPVEQEMHDHLGIASKQGGPS